MIYIRRNTVLKTLLSLVVVLVVVKIQPSTFFTTLDFLPSPSTFYPHPRPFTLTLDFLPSPSTLDPRHSTLDKNLNSGITCRALIDSGASSSYASAKLINLLNTKPSEIKRQRIDMLMSSCSSVMESYDVNICASDDS